MTTNNIVRTLERKGEIVTAKPGRHTAVRRAAERLSRRNRDQAVCELMNEALQRLVALCYETDGGGLCNVDAVTGRILIPLPWGRHGHAKWGLRPSEANVMRQIAYSWQDTGLALFSYDRLRRAWFVNLHDFGTAGAAKSWLKSSQIDIVGYRAARDKVLAKN